MHFDRQILRFTEQVEEWSAARPPLRTSLAWIGGLGAFTALTLLLSSGVALNSHLIDYFFMLESAWRLDNGQLPYRDFPTPIGPVFYAMIWATVRVFGLYPASFIWTPLLFGLPVALGIAGVAWRRLAPHHATFVAGTALLTMVAPRFVDADFVDLSFVAYYNKASWLLAAAPLLLAGFPPRRDLLPHPRHIVAEGVFTGACLALLALTKANFVVVCGGAMLAGLLLWPANRRPTAIALLTGAGLTGAWFALFPSLGAAYLQDILATAEANRLGSRLSLKANAVVSEGRPIIYLSLLVIWLVEQYRKQDSTLWRGVAAVLLLAASNAALVFNDHGDYPVLIVLVLLAAYHTVMASHPSGDAALGAGALRAKRTLALLPALAIGGWNAMHDSVSLLVHAGASWATPAVRSEAFSAPRLDDLRLSTLPNSPAPLGAIFGELREAAQLLEEHDLRDKKILMGDRTNILPYLLGSPPPTGAPAWFDAYRTISPTGFPDPRRTFEDTDVLVIHRSTSFPQTRDIFLHVYQDVIDRDFEPVVTTERWAIHKRSEPATAQAD